MVDTLVVSNGEILPSNIYEQGRTPTEFFAKRHQKVWTLLHYYRDALKQRDYAEDYGIIARDHICEFITVPDI